MARVASCPQCEHDLLVPDDAVPSALVKCPQCRAFFELQHAESRELPSAFVVKSHPEPSALESKRSKSPTIADFSSLATLKAELEPISEEELRHETDIADTVDFADEKVESDHSPALPPGPRLADTHEFKPAGTESHEDAAQRIDQWFRSAKTLSDMPPLSESDLAGESSHEMLEPTTGAAGGETIDMSSEHAEYAEDASGFELETPSDSPHDAAPWDDSQHMDRLLADIEGQPIDTYEPESHEASSPHEEQEHFQPAGDWTPDESLAIPSTAGKPERKRSIVRTLVLTAFGGIDRLGPRLLRAAMAGPGAESRQRDRFLGNRSLFAASLSCRRHFAHEVKQLPSLPPSKMAADLAASENVAKSESTPSTEPAPVAPPTSEDSTAKTPVAPAEKQAAFTTPVEPAKKAADTDDRYAIPAHQE